MNQLDLADDRRVKPVDVLPTILAYIEGIKVRETALLTAVGVSSAAITPSGLPPVPLFMAVLASILLASAGVNGLTCYLDREWDAKMERTRKRPLPSGRIAPHPFLITVLLTTILGLSIGYAINPLVAMAGLVGTFTAVVARKTWITHYFGIISSLTPVWMGWLAVSPKVDWTLGSISAMVSIWVLIHVWSLMLSYRDDYLNAGLRIFPVTAEIKTSVRWIAFLTVSMTGSACLIFYTGSFGAIFASAAVLLSIIALIAALTLLTSNDPKSAWRLYKFSAFPFLGLMFVAMVIDRLIH